MIDVLWRGPIDSCNYGCAYCPFAKSRSSLEERQADAHALSRFVDWAGSRTHGLGVFFTPWGEALVHRHYTRAIARLSSMAHVSRVAIQTNLSTRLDGLDAGDPAKVQLWATYHPDWTTLDGFLAQVERARARGLALSVGIVGFPEHLHQAEALRAALPADVYLWVNAVKRLADAYTPEHLARIEAIDPLFRANLRPHVSQGRACSTGERVVSVDGDGTVRRCHFVPTVLGNLYETDLLEMLRPRGCPKAQCRCHIGYVHLDDLGLRSVFGSGLLARIPAGWPDRAHLPDTAVSDAEDLEAPALVPVDNEARRERDQSHRPF